MKSRLDTAVAFLKEGQSFKVDDIRLGIGPSGDIEVIGWSQYGTPQYLTRATALEELEEIKKLFFEMLSFSTELQAFAKEKNIGFYLHFDDSGKGSVAICNEMQGVVYWSMELQ